MKQKSITRMLTSIVKMVLGVSMCSRIREWRRRRLFRRRVKLCFDYDSEHFIRYSGWDGQKTRNMERAEIIISYHILEKGLTMPNRRKGFGRQKVSDLIQQITDFCNKYGDSDSQIFHAIRVIKAYKVLHSDSKDKEIDDFLFKYKDIEPATEFHFRKEEFYADRDAPFPQFARSRHTIRNYAATSLPLERIRRAVEIARTTPTACNKQYCRVYCLSDKAKIAEVLSLQGGNRGFGHLADKCLIVTVDIEGVVPCERNDVFTNGGMFLMNLCYALFYEEVAHCVLNWSQYPDKDIHLRKIVPIKDSECVVAVLSCGEAPREFDVACSPRISIDEILKS